MLFASSSPTNETITSDPHISPDGPGHRRSPHPGQRPVTFLYHITQRHGGKVYVGQTTNTTRRWQQHQRNPPTLLKRDLPAGSTVDDAFTFTVIAELGPDDNANKAEADEIKRLRNDGVHLYNRMTGCPAANKIFWALRGEKNKRR